ncbi:MAG: alpha/beta fold hydrolase [Crocinitomicaceae bacterium]
MIVRINNSELNYTLIKPKKSRSDSAVLLFLHEALGSIGQWKNFPQDLCDELGLTGIVYERQGHGASSPFTSPRDHMYLHDYALKELPEFVEKEIKEKSIILVGHSDGGTIALLYANKYPSNLLGIITMAAHVINEPETVAGILPAVDAYKAGKLNGLRKYHGEKTETLFYAWADTWRSKEFADWNICNEIGSSLVPGLFIQGAEDQYGTIEQLKLIQQKFNNLGKTVMLEDCGHHPHLEKSAEVISLITKWISDSIAIS